MGVFTHSRAHKSAIQTELASHRTSWTKHEVNAILLVSLFVEACLLPQWSGIPINSTCKYRYYFTNKSQTLRLLFENVTTANKYVVLCRPIQAHLE